MDHCQTECCWSPLTPSKASIANRPSHSLLGLGHCCATMGNRTPSQRTAVFCTVLSGQRPSPALLCHSQSSGCVTLTAQAVSLSQLRLCHFHSSGCVTHRTQAVSLSELRLCHSQSSGRVTLRAQAVSLTELRLCHSQSSGCITLRAQAVTLRAQKLCESRGGRPGLPVSNSSYGLCGRKSTLNDLNLAMSELRSCVPV